MLRIAMCPIMCSLLGEVPKTVEENVHSACLDEIVCKGSSCSMILFNLDTSLEMAYLVWKCGIEVTQCYCVGVNL